MGSGKERGATCQAWAGVQGCTAGDPEDKGLWQGKDCRPGGVWRKLKRNVENQVHGVGVGGGRRFFITDTEMGRAPPAIL